MIINEKNAKIEKLIKGIFVYPTDTIYGIGCNAENEKLVEKIRKIKKRDKKPFSIIAPNKEFILKNFETTKKLIDKYLPGPYTLILKKKNPAFLKSVSENEFVGVRIPDHPFTRKLQKSEKPIVTTSMNLSGEPPIKSISEIKNEIKDKIDFIIDAGKIDGKPSTIILGDRKIKR